MAAILLLHGAFHASWCWHKIVPRLERLGHDVVAIDLPGHGRNRTTSPPTLDQYVDATIDALRAMPQAATVVAHSMGGAILSRICEEAPELVHKAVYLASFLPGETARSMSDGAAEDNGSLLAPYISTLGDGAWLTVATAGIRPVFFGDCSDDDVALAHACLTPQSARALATPICWSAKNSGAITKVYIECLADCAISIGQQRVFQSRYPVDAVIALNASHSPFFSVPDELAEIISAATI